MSTFIYVSGITFWALLALAGMVVLLDWGIQKLSDRLFIYGEFMAFVWKRARERAKREARS